MGSFHGSPDGARRRGRARAAAVSAALLAAAAFAAAALAAGGPAGAVGNVPYALPVLTPAPVASPPVDPAAPYTPTVMSLLAQLLPGHPPTPTQIAQASRLLTAALDDSNPSCHSLAQRVPSTITTPRIMPLCFSDGRGIQVYPARSATSGARAIQTTALPSTLALGATFDRALANAVGQLQGREGRSLMITALLGPQLDTDVFVNWYRGLDTPGEDPWLNGVIGAAEVNGMQGQGLMAQIKHFAADNGTRLQATTELQDQALHELLLPPYELALTQGAAASVMCSYAQFRDISTHLPARVDALTQPSAFARGSPPTWSLDQAHYGCEQPLTLTYVLRGLWGSKAFVGTDYGAAHSASAILQGDDHEAPDTIYLDGTDPQHALDASSATCADQDGEAADCDAEGAERVAGIPGPGCPATGCAVAHAVANGTLPLAVFTQALARLLYQQERFGMLGCDNDRAACDNPGGVGADRSGTAPLPAGPTDGVPVPGTRNGDAAIVEQVAEEGAVLFKNDAQALPISEHDLAGGIAVSGGGAEYLIASPDDEGSDGFAARVAINPLQQLQGLSGHAAAFQFTPANAPTGQAAPCIVLRSLRGAAAPGEPPARCGPDSGLRRFEGASPQLLAPGPIDRQIDFTRASAQGPLRGGRVYRWEGWLYVPTADQYVFRLQHSAGVPDAKVGFSLDGRAKRLQQAVSFYQGQYYGRKSVRVTPTNAGYIEAGLRNRQCAVSATAADAGAAAPGIGECAVSPAVGWHRVAITLDGRALERGAGLSLRFAWSRRHGDIADAARAAAGKAMALVFVNDQGREVVCEGGACRHAGPSTRISSLAEDQLQLIDAVAAANPNTVVVLNTATPVVVKEWIDNPHVRAVLNLWYAGQEGATAAARLLLGQANPSGHTSITWPRDNGDTIYGYAQPTGLYPGDSPGAHPERLDGAAGGNSAETQGIFSGYRYYDRLGLAVRFPFGFGLSYTRFRFSQLRLQPRDDGGLDVDFELENTGTRAGAEVAQVYVGAGPGIPGVQQAVRSLRGFERVSLEPGGSRHVTIRLDARAFEYWSEPQQRWIAHGPRTIQVGDADDPAHLPLAAVAPMPGAPAAGEPPGGRRR